MGYRSLASVVPLDILGSVSEAVLIHRYQLLSKFALNAKSERQQHHGALICVDGGVGCIHPWPELGDAPLDQQLELLRRGESSALLRSALACAKLDGEARRAGRSLFDGFQVPESHATLSGTNQSVESAVQAGFSTVKMKLGRDLPAELAKVAEWMQQYPSLRWRFDFNGTVGRDDVKCALGLCPDDQLRKIDFIEDAYLLPTEVGGGPENMRVAVSRAVDRELEKALAGEWGFEVAVIKPAVTESSTMMSAVSTNVQADAGLLRPTQAVITSYMDHPLGQSYAAWVAAVAKSDYPDCVDLCGLMTHGLFEPDAFSSALGPVTPRFAPAKGTGLGFDDELENLPWKPLI